jgi:hypothetical protein
MLLQAIMFSLLLQKVSIARPLGIGLISHSLYVNHSSKKANCDNSATYSTSTLTVNPLTFSGQLPKFKHIKPENVVPALQDDLNSLKRGFSGSISILL